MLQRTGVIFLVLALAWLAAAPATAATGPRSGIAATVNDEVITFSDIESRLDMYLAGQKGTPPPEVRRKLMLQVLDKLINERLEMQEAKKLGITIGDAQVKDGFAHLAKQNNFSPDQFRQRLSASGVKIDTLHDQIRAELAWAQVVRRKLRPQVSVSEAEIDTAVEQMASSKGKTQYLVAEILLPVASADTDDLVRRDADKLVAEIRKGASFSKVARDVSKAPGAAQGGDLGWVRAGTLDKALDAALAQLRPGEITAPIRTDKGYHILFLRNVQEGGAGTVSAKPAAPKAAAAPAPASAPKTSTVVRLRQIVIPISADDPAPIVNAKVSRAASLKAEISSCADMEKKSKDFLTPGTGELGEGPLGGLPAPLRQAVENLPVGELSAPVRGDNGVAVLMVCDRREETVAGAAPASEAAPVAEEVAAAPPEAPAEEASAAPPADDQKFREEVANRIGMKRLEQMQEHYLRDLRAAAFIEKRL